MRIYVLGPDGKAFAQSAEWLPRIWRQAILETAGGMSLPENESIRENAAQLAGMAGGPEDHDAEILKAFGKWRRGAKVIITQDPQNGVRESNDPLEYIKASAIAGWLLDLEILREFEERASGYDGYVKITDDAVEYGWLDQHDGLHRKRG